MNKFSENHPEKLDEFIKQLNLLVDEFHPNLYLLDGVFEGLDKIKQTVNEEKIKCKLKTL
jgi:hypothetical protein